MFKVGNPDSTPDDPREIAKDLRILKAKQKLVRLEGGMRNPSISKEDEQIIRLQVSAKGVKKNLPIKVEKGNDKPSIVKGYAGDYISVGAEWVKKLNNPGGLDSAESLVEEFHGRSPNSIDDIVSFDSFPDSLAELGELRELVVVSPHFKGKLPIGFDEEGNGVVKLASAPGGTQYILVGGDQSLSPESLEEDFGIEGLGEEWQRKVILGELVSLTYFTDKHHLSGPKYQKNGCLYEHELGEEGGELPTLVYDPNNETLEIVGGSYITRAEGIRN